MTTPNTNLVGVTNPSFVLPWYHPRQDWQNDENWRALERWANPLVGSGALPPGANLPQVYALLAIERNKGGTINDTSTLASDVRVDSQTGGANPGWVEQGAPNSDIKVGGITYNSTLGGWTLPVSGVYLFQHEFFIDGPQTGGFDKVVILGADGSTHDTQLLPTIPNTHGGANIVLYMKDTTMRQAQAGDTVGPSVWNRTNGTIVLRIMLWTAQLIAPYPPNFTP